MVAPYASSRFPPCSRSKRVDPTTSPTSRISNTVSRRRERPSLVEDFARCHRLGGGLGIESPIPNQSLGRPPVPAKARCLGRNERLGAPSRETPRPPRSLSRKGHPLTQVRSVRSGCLAPPRWCEPPRRRRQTADCKTPSRSRCARPLASRPPRRTRCSARPGR